MPDRRVWPVPGAVAPQGKRHPRATEEWQFVLTGDAVGKRTISLVRGRMLPGGPRVEGRGRCARVATSALSAPYRTRNGDQVAAGRGSRLTTHAPQAAQAVTLPASLDEAVAALAAVPAAVRGRRHRPHGRRQLRTAAARRARRPRPDQRDPRLAVPTAALLGAGLTHARMGRPDFAALIPALAAAARAAGPPQIRNAGTLGGNIASAAPAMLLPCWPHWKPR